MQGIEIETNIEDSQQVEKHGEQEMKKRYPEETEDVKERCSKF